MNPEDAIWLRACASRNQSMRNPAQAFDKSASIFAVAQNLVEPKRQAQQHTERQHQTVEKIAQAEPF
jgi:mannose/cellobiose epimerase-like protein (N-acyl-D-glucosamine 2-epimerase family)